MARSKQVPSGRTMAEMREALRKRQEMLREQGLLVWRFLGPAYASADRGAWEARAIKSLFAAVETEVNLRAGSDGPHGELLTTGLELVVQMTSMAIRDPAGPIDWTSRWVLGLYRPRGSEVWAFRFQEVLAVGFEAPALLSECSLFAAPAIVKLHFASLGAKKLIESALAVLGEAS